MDGRFLIRCTCRDAALQQGMLATSQCFARHVCFSYAKHSFCSNSKRSWESHYFFLMNKPTIGFIHWSNSTHSHAVAMPLHAYSFDKKYQYLWENPSIHSGKVPEQTSSNEYKRHAHDKKNYPEKFCYKTVDTTVFSYSQQQGRWPESIHWHFYDFFVHFLLFMGFSAALVLICF